MRPEHIRDAIAIITIDDAAYPARLRAIFDPPSPLYVRGELRPADESAVAIVGARRATEYGKAVAEHLAGELVRHGMTVVSGMARGIDAAAHRGALAAGGRTIAVLGCGPDVVYPPEHGRAVYWGGSSSNRSDAAMRAPAPPWAPLVSSISRSATAIR